MIAHAIARYLAAEITGLTYGTGANVNVFVDWMPDKTDTAIAVMGQPGVANLTRLPHSEPGVQIIVRGAKGTDRATHDRAAAIHDTLTCLRPGVIASGTVDAVHVVGITPDQDEPISIGRDELDRPEYSINFSLRTHNPTSHRPAVTA